jgi:hypothetical protein
VYQDELDFTQLHSLGFLLRMSDEGFVYFTADLCILQQIYSNVLLVSQQQESDITESVGDGLTSPSMGVDVLSDTSVIGVYLCNCCHIHPTVHCDLSTVK